jgi:hypothetical protein
MEIADKFHNFLYIFYFMSSLKYAIQRTWLEFRLHIYSEVKPRYFEPYRVFCNIFCYHHSKFKFGMTFNSTHNGQSTLYEILTFSSYISGNLLMLSGLKHPGVLFSSLPYLYEIKVICFIHCGWRPRRIIGHIFVWLSNSLGRLWPHSRLFLIFVLWKGPSKRLC